jgi:hypothetical protein
VYAPTVTKNYRVDAKEEQQVTENNVVLHVYLHMKKQ